MRVVVTGNMGCGKSTAVRIMREMLPQYELFDFDGHVHWMYEHDEDFKQHLIDTFGTCIRKEISEMVFADRHGDAARNMVKLRLFSDAKITEAMVTAFDANLDIILDVPLWFEMQDMLVGYNIRLQPDIIFCVTCDEESQMERIRRRNKYPQAKIDKILKQQWPQSMKADRADYVIPNYGTQFELEDRVEALLLANKRFWKP